MELKISQKRVSRRIKWPQDGFSLIELLVVVAIIAILAGLILQTAGYVQNRAARSRAQTEIAAISAALESYRADYGDYPRWPNTNVSAANSANLLFQALVLSNTSLNPIGKVYLDAPNSILLTPSQPNSTANQLIDPFGQPYNYQYPGATNRSGPQFFDLWSFAGISSNATNAPRWEKNW